MQEGQTQKKKRVSWGDQTNRRPLVEVQYIEVVGKGQKLPKDKRDLRMYNLSNYTQYIPSYRIRNLGEHP